MKLGGMVAVAIAFGVPTAGVAGESVPTKLEPVSCPADEAVYSLSDDTVGRIITKGAGDTFAFRIAEKEQANGKVVLQASPADSATVVEEYRKSRIRLDLDAILKFGKDELGRGEALSDNLCFIYAQKFKRSSLDIKAVRKSGNEPEEVIREKRVLVGPAEHLYLSVDMPVTDIKQLKYDSTEGQIVEKEEPPTAYLGLNWMLGDVYERADWNRPWRKLSIKGMAKIGKRPNESMGIGLGYNLGPVEIFAARVWTKDDPEVSGADLGTTESTVYGVSFNVLRGIGWFKGD